MRYTVVSTGSVSSEATSSVSSTTATELSSCTFSLREADVTAVKTDAVSTPSEITDAELKAASAHARFSVSEAELEHKLAVNAAGTKADPIVLVPGANSGTAPKSGSDKYCYFTYTAASEGTVTLSSEGTDWRANYYINGEQQNTNLINPKYDGSTITCDLAAGDTFLLMISPYKSYMYGGDITVDFQFSGEGGEVTEPTDPSEPEPTDPTDPTVPEEDDGGVG